MLDHILGRPSPVVRRSQVFLVIFFWLWRLYKGDGAAPLPSRTVSGARPPLPSGRIGETTTRRLRNVVRRTWLWKLWLGLVGRSPAVPWMGKLNDKLKHLTPYQLILGTLTFAYALRHIDDLLGLGAPEPLAKLYSRSYYRATYVNTAFDAGFATAMSIRPKWLRDISSIFFTAYYLVWADEGDNVLRKFRALCTVEMLRVTWEKTNNPYIRLLTVFQRPSLPIARRVSIKRPSNSSRAHLSPVRAMLLFAGDEAALAKCTELVVDFPGGGFIAMGPECHEERLRRWARRTMKPVLSVDYGKAPEYPYPWAIEEGFDAYRTLMETKGECIGIKSRKLGIVLTGDSAGGNICATIMLRILEHSTQIPRPVSMILAYPALDFNFRSWMSPADLRVLRTEQSTSHVPGIAQTKDHMRHKSPLSVVPDVQKKKKKQQQQNAGRRKSWGEALSSKLPGLSSPTEERKSSNATSTSPGGWASNLPRTMSAKVAGWLVPGAVSGTDDGGHKRPGNAESGSDEDDDDDDDEEDDDDDGSRTVRAGPRQSDSRREEDKSLRERVKTPKEERKFQLTALHSSQEGGNAAAAQVAGVEKDGAAAAAAEVTKEKKRKRAPIGTRLTMTSRVGYFQDRIISPSMMRAMAILYVGPRRNPDFETDYYISPILSPPHLLAHFPPVYLICGERDPFVDDTVIFAGKIREAKHRRRSEAEMKSQSRSARWGEGLRMSAAVPAAAGGPASTSPPDHIVRETDDDWVQMRIIEGWGHGFMQMAALMKEVDSVLVEMADWIDESFEKAEAVERDMRDVAQAHAHAASLQAQQAHQGPYQLASPDDYLIPVAASTRVKAVNEYKKVDSGQVLGGADLGAPVSFDPVQDENDGVIAFTPKTRRVRKPPPSSLFTPVPRQTSKDKLTLPRSGSAPRFDFDDSPTSSYVTAAPARQSQQQQMPAATPEPPRGSGAFAFFSSGARAAGASSRQTTKPPQPIVYQGLYGSMSIGGAGGTPQDSRSLSPPTVGDKARRGSSGASASAGTGTGAAGASRPTNSLVAAAVAGARAANPALAAAGLVPQHVEHVTEAELMRRRRTEAVWGMGETESAVHSDGDDE